jgi:uncharacterized membrane protein YqgA involved in biofilm formation
VELRLMHLLSSIGKEILGTIQKAFRRVFVSFILVFLIVAVGIEAASFFLNGKFPPDGTTHLAAAALALAVGFAVGVTVAVEEILRGVVKAIELLVKETEKLAGEAVGAVENLVSGDSRRVQDFSRGADTSGVPVKSTE